jgi:hypothetical protein
MNGNKVWDDLIKATAIAYGQDSRKNCREGCQGVELPREVAEARLLFTFSAWRVCFHSHN